MIKRISSVLLILTLVISVLMPMSVVSASERITLTYNDANYGGNGSYNVYGSFSAFSTGAYAEFAVQIEEAGKYTISARLRGTESSIVRGKVGTTEGYDVVLDDSPVASEVTLLTVDLKEGPHRVTLQSVSQITYIFELYVTKVKEPLGSEEKKGAYKTHILPTVIEAENFDHNSSKSKTATSLVNQAYRSDSYLKIAKDGGEQVVTMNKGDSMLYTVRVNKAGLFDFSAYVTAEGDVKAYFDSSSGYVTGSLERYKDTSLGTVYLTKGTHKIKIESVSDGLSIDKIRFKSSTKNSAYYDPKDLTEGKAVVIKKEINETEVVPNPVWKNLYVSTNGSDSNDGSAARPFATIGKARDAVRKMSSSMRGDIIVNIEPGKYFVEETIKFGIDDSGKNGFNIIYRGTDPENKPIIHGGKKIEGWEKVQGNIWAAKAPKEIDVMRQLYINELPASIAQSKYLYEAVEEFDNPETAETRDGYYVNKKNFPVLSNTEDASIRFDHDWTLSYINIKEIVDDGDRWRIEFDQPYFQRYYNHAHMKGIPKLTKLFHLVNAPELLDEPGEFYYDRKTKTVYYYGYDEEDLSTAEVYTTFTEGLIDVAGEGSDDKIKNITFDNIDFRYGAWNEVAEKGFSGGQGDSMVDPDDPNKEKAANIWQWKWMLSQVEINYADNVNVVNCSFIDHGSTALAMREGVTNSKIQGNYFQDISSSGVLVGNVYRSEVGITTETVTRDISVNNNVFRRIGLDYIGGISVQVLYAGSVDVLNNDIKDTSYSGISLGWGWGSQLPIKFKCNGHLVANNRIDRTGLMAFDGASIYNLSDSRGTIIQGNYMSRSEDTGGIYFDQGSDNIVARDNVFEDNKKNTFFFNHNGCDYYRNYANYYDKTPRFIRKDGVKPTELVHRIEGYNWGPEARAIMANAGLEAEYKYLLNQENAEHPSWRKLPFAQMHIDRFNTYDEIRIDATSKDHLADGGEGVAYHDTDPKGPNFSGGMLGYTKEGEWVKYNVEAQTDRDYTLYLVYSLDPSTEGNSEVGITMSINGEEVCTDVRLGSTGGWANTVAVPMADVRLNKGNNELKLLFAKDLCAVFDFLFINDGNELSEAHYDDGVYFKLPN